MFLLNIFYGLLLFLFHLPTLLHAFCMFPEFTDISYLLKTLCILSSWLLWVYLLYWPSGLLFQLTSKREWSKFTCLCHYFESEFFFPITSKYVCWNNILNIKIKWQIWHDFVCNHTSSSNVHSAVAATGYLEWFFT